MLLLARSELSFKNGWIDEDAKPYIYCTRSEMGELLNTSEPTTVKIFKQLIGAELIKIGKKSQTGSARLYVKDIISRKETYKSEQQAVRSFKSDDLHDALLKNFMSGSF